MKYFESETPGPTLTECFASPGGQDLIADVFVPDKSRHNGAAAIFIHGGGWSGGKRQDFLWHAHRLSLHGYVACTIDYRLAPAACFSAMIKDCQAAARWLRKNAGRFDIRSDRIGAMGSSAGGHLAACLGVFDNNEDTVSAKVNVVVDIHGIHDFILLAENSVNGPEHWEKLVGGPVSEKRDLWIEASPALRVNSNTAPMFLAHDPQDTTIPYVQSSILAHALIKASRPMQFLPSPGSGHGFVYNPQNTWTQQVWPIAVAWLDRHLQDMPSDGRLSEDY